jgi:LacI family transcriptional regulator
VPTIKEVAKRAGIAVSTASDALNGKPGVSPRTRQRALEAAEALGYVPNPIAQGLVTRATKNVGVILSGPSSFELFTNPAFVEVIRAVTVTLSKRKYHTLLNVISTEEEVEVIPEVARSRLVEALILVGTRRNDQELARLLEEVSIPSTVVIRSALDSVAYAVSVDNNKCGYVATRHLLELGHRSIGYIGNLPGVSPADERLAGYHRALEEWSIAYDESLVAPGDFYQESGSVAMRRLLDKAKDKITAVFAANDLMALGAMEALEQEGISIPEDISLVGCDDIPNLHLLRVPLTSISLPSFEIGRLAAEKVMGVLEGDDRLPTQIVLEPKLKIRSSAKALANA